MRLRSLLLNNGFLILVALAVGIITGFSYKPRESTYLLLGTIMTLSVTKVDFERMRAKGKKGLIIPVLLVYGFSPLMTLIPAYFLINNQDFLYGFTVMAIVPSAISLIAFTGILDGDVELALSGTGSVYTASLILMPLMGWLLLGEVIDVVSLFYSVFLLLVVPILLSRVLVVLRADERLGEGKKYLTNILFFLLVLNIVGARREAFFIEPSSILIIGLICLLRSSVAGTLVYFAAKRLGVDEGDSRTYVLFGAFKNGGLAVALSVTLFSPEAAIPAAISIVFDMGSIGYYDMLFRRFGKNSR